MSFSDKIKVLRRWELDAFIAQAFSPELMNAQHLQDLQVTYIIIFLSKAYDGNSILSFYNILYYFLYAASFSNITRSTISYFIHGRC